MSLECTNIGPLTISHLLNTVILRGWYYRHNNEYFVSTAIVAQDGVNDRLYSISVQSKQPSLQEQIRININPETHIIDTISVRSGTFMFRITNEEIQLHCAEGEDRVTLSSECTPDEVEFSSSLLGMNGVLVSSYMKNRDILHGSVIQFMKNTEDYGI